MAADVQWAPALNQGQMPPEPSDAPLGSSWPCASACHVVGFTRRKLPGRLRFLGAWDGSSQDLGSEPSASFQASGSSHRVPSSEESHCAPMRGTVTGPAANRILPRVLANRRSQFHLVSLPGTLVYFCKLEVGAPRQVQLPCHEAGTRGHK